MGHSVFLVAESGNPTDVKHFLSAPAQITAPPSNFLSCKTLNPDFHASRNPMSTVSTMHTPRMG